MAKRSMRVEYGKYLAELGEKHLSIVVLEADLRESTQSIQFQQAFPERYFNIGIAEQNMVGIAAGLALEEKIPFVHSFACFISMRSCEQVRTSVAYPNLNVKLVVSHGGISTGTAGTTHHAIEDLSIMRSIPNLMVLVPGDVEEMKQVIGASFDHKGPVYVRLTAGDVEDVYGLDHQFSIGKATKLREGDEATIISTGIMVHSCVMASDLLLKNFRIKARVLQMASVKPLDKVAIVQAVEETGRIVTVEENTILGGLGGAVCEVVAETGKAKVKRIGVKDHFCGVGSAAFLMELEGLTVENIVDSVRLLVQGAR